MHIEMNHRIKKDVRTDHDIVTVWIPEHAEVIAAFHVHVQ
jgi:hypothetical protein